MRLTLFFTDGVSLKTWRDVGMLDRELALYKALQERGVEIGFVTYGDRSDLDFGERVPGVELRVNEAQLPNLLYQRSLQSDPPKGDVFKSNQVAGADAALHSARKKGAKFIARCGYLLSEFQERRYGDKSHEAKAARRLEKEVFSSADAVVVTTRAMQDSLQDRYAIRPDLIQVVPNYVETDRFKPAQEKKGEKPRVVFIGRLDKQKNVIAFIEAVSNLDVEVWLIGYGPQRATLESKTQNAKAQFHFLGSVPNSQLPALLNSCDLYVLPSLYEGHPKALLEAMACGLPVVGTRVPGTREIIRDGENGLLCETDADSIRGAISHALNDLVLRERLSKAGRLFVEQHFALKRVVDLEMHVLQKFGEQ